MVIPNRKILTIMRIGVLSFHQSINDHPDRFISKSEAKKLVRKLTHEKVSKYIIHELAINATPSSSPNRHVVPKVSVTKVPKLNPPTQPSTLNLFYPVADQSSFAARDFKQVWDCDMDEWRRRIGA